MTRIARVLAAVALLLAALLGCGHGKPSSAEYVEEDVTFVADGLTIHGTYRHPAAETPAPAALLISESGMTDRNGDNAVAGPVGNMRQLAEYLSGRGVASRRRASNRRRALSRIARWSMRKPPMRRKCVCGRW